MASTMILTMLVLMVPCVSSDADAFEEIGDGLVISTVREGDIVVPVESGGTASIELLVTNTSPDPVAIGVQVEGMGEDVSVSMERPGTLDAFREGDYFGTVTVTFTVGGYAGERVDDCIVLVTVLDITGTTRTVYDVPVTLRIESVYGPDDAYNRFLGIIPNTLGEPLDGPWVTASVTFVVWVFLTFVTVRTIVPSLIGSVGVRKTREERDRVRDRLTVSVMALMAVMAVNQCASIVGVGPGVEYIVDGVSNLFYVAIGAVITWQVYIFVITSFLRELDERADVDGMDMSLLPLFRMVGKLAICVVAVCLALAAFGVDLAGMMVSAGVVTLGITLGAQSTLNQFFSGIVLLATRPFRKGDYVRIGDAYYSVRRVRLMYTEFMNWDEDQIVTMPNNVVSGATIVNLSRELGRTRVFAYVDVAYGSDIEKVKECLKRAGMAHPRVIKDGSCIPPDTRLTNFGASGITFRLACYVDDFDFSADYAGEIRELIYREFNENGIEIPYNRIQVDVLTEPAGWRDGTSTA